MKKLSDILIEMALTLGAFKVGIATTETLAGGPPSADLTYVLPEAKSGICFAIAFDQSLINNYFNKKDHKSLETNKVRSTTLANGIALEIAGFLKDLSYKASPQAANFVYRKDTENGLLDMKPPISHRYLAIRSGIGHFGYSGHVITKEYGAAIVIDSVITDAKLCPTEPLPEEKNYCDGCKLCLQACSSGFVDPVEKVAVTLGGRDYTYGKRRSYARCTYVCGGLAGLNPSGKWSTWSPARFEIPAKDEAFSAMQVRAMKAFLKRPKFQGGFFMSFMPNYRMEYTCSNCQLICHPDKEVRKDRYRMLKESGVVIEEPDGTRRVVSPKEAKEHLESMPPERKSLYELVF